MSSLPTSPKKIPASKDIPSSNEIPLSICNLTAGYGKRPVLERVNLELQPGASLALVGPNGAGKTTLIRAILGLVPVLDGSLKVFGQTPQVARSSVAYVPQVEALDPEFPISVLDVVLMGRYRKAGWFRRLSKTDREKAVDALTEVGLKDRAKDRFGILSGGQRQRVLLARAIAQEAKLLLLDEPFNGVDSSTTEIVLQVLQRLRGEGSALVMSTHDLSIAHLACSEACLLNHHQFAHGPVGTTLTPDLLGKTYGGSTVLLAGDSTVITTE